MVAVAYTDLPNGIIIVLACLLSVPFVYLAAGGLSGAESQLKPEYFWLVNEHFGRYPYLKVGGYFLSTMLLLLGVQTMYQKFYSAKTPKDAKKAVIWWTLGTIFVETMVVIIAVFSYSKFKDQIDLSIPKEGGKVILLAARYLVPPPIGVLLLGAACAVVISTGMNYLLSSSTNIIRDIYQRHINKRATQSALVAIQKVFVAFLGVGAFLMAMNQSSVLDTAFFAYTIYGAAITPALIAALVWKRVTRAGGLASITAATSICLVLKLLTYVLPPSMVYDGEPWGVPIIFPAFAASILALVIVSLFTKKPSAEILAKFFPERGKKICFASMKVVVKGGDDERIKGSIINSIIIFWPFFGRIH